jgi:hypothetical protein
MTGFLSENKNEDTEEITTVKTKDQLEKSSARRYKNMSSETADMR